jgi:hypothetical protein
MKMVEEGRVPLIYFSVNPGECDIRIGVIHTPAKYGCPITGSGRRRLNPYRRT